MKEIKNEKGIEKAKDTENEKSIEKAKETENEKGIEKTKETENDKGIEKTKETENEKGIEKAKETENEKGIDTEKGTTEYKSAKDMKNLTFADSIKCAFQGLHVAFRTEKNFAIYFGIAVFFLIVNILCKVSLVLFIPYFLAVGGVFSAELLNTAIEHVANFISNEIRDEIKYVKDIAAGAVLFFGFVYFIVEFLILFVTVWA